MDLLPIAKAVLCQGGDSNERKFSMPVNHLCGIDVSITIRRWMCKTKNNYDLTVGDRYCCVESGNSYRYLYGKRFDNLEACLKGFEHLLENAYFDNFTARIKDTPPCAGEVKKMECLKAFYQKYKGNEKIKLNHGECCVCYQLTKTRTCCGHQLCLTCAIKIEEEAAGKVDYGDSPEYKCPMCREENFMLRGVGHYPFEGVSTSYGVPCLTGFE
jgi:hypothetical protein